MKYPKEYQTHFCLEDRKIENINKIEKLKYNVVFKIGVEQIENNDKFIFVYIHLRPSLRRLSYKLSYVSSSKKLFLTPFQTSILWIKCETSWIF